MSIPVDDARLLQFPTFPRPVATINVSEIEILRVCPAHAIPSVLSLGWRFAANAKAKSTVMFRSDVKCPDGSVASEDISHIVDAGPSEITLRLSSLAVNTAGTYTFTLFAEGQLKCSESVDFIVGP